MKALLLTPAFALTLGACSAGATTLNGPRRPTPPAEQAAERAEQAACGADRVMRYERWRDSARTRAAIGKAAGHNRIRFIAHDTAVTMDYRPDRLNVSFDRKGRIFRINCG